VKLIAVGENITVLINVRSCEDKVISDGKIDDRAVWLWVLSITEQ
jgi:hypothetical protein